MTPREREAWLAEHLLGWRWRTRRGCASRLLIEPPMCDDMRFWGPDDPALPVGAPPDLDLQSWEGLGCVVEAMETRGWRWESWGNNPDSSYGAAFVHWPDFQRIVSPAQATPWEAVICAAIRALGGTP